VPLCADFNPVCDLRGASSIEYIFILVQVSPGVSS
jgi:hypothetical protein